MNALEQAREDINAIDEAMAELFVRRLEAAARVLEYKRENSLPIFDAKREDEVITNGMKRMENPRYSELYKKYIVNLMDISKEYQRMLLEENKSI